MVAPALRPSTDLPKHLLASNAKLFAGQDRVISGEGGHARIDGEHDVVSQQRCRPHLLRTAGTTRSTPGSGTSCSSDRSARWRLLLRSGWRRPPRPPRATTCDTLPSGLSRLIGHAQPSRRVLSWIRAPKGGGRRTIPPGAHARPSQHGLHRCGMRAERHLAANKQTYCVCVSR